MAYRRPRRVKRPRFGKRRYKRKLTASLASWPRTRVVKGVIVHSTTSGVTTGGAIGGSVIKINSLNDPLGVGGANLPLGLDEASRLYKRYRVLGAKLTIVGHPVTITGGGVFGLHITRESSMLTDMDHYRELKGTVARTVSPDIDIFKVSIKYSPKQLWKFKDIKDQENQEASLIGTGSIGNVAPADPTDIAYVHMFFQDMNKTDNLAFDITYRVDYILQLSDPVTPSRSTL